MLRLDEGICMSWKTSKIEQQHIISSFVWAEHFNHISQFQMKSYLQYTINCKIE